MAATSLFFLALALFAGVSSAEHERIINGNPVPIQSYRSVVQVEALQQGIFWLHTCGGSIINSIHILSAAHCFSGRNYSPEGRRIRAGTATKEAGGVIVHISQEFNHPTFGLNGNDGDITVVRLSSALLFNDFIDQAPFVASGANLPGGMLVTKVGWGVTAVNSAERSPVLREVHVFTTDLNLCRNNYATLQGSPPVTDNMFCAGSAVADACEGDKGGPVFVSNIVVGVMSWGNGCLIPGFPGVNTNVSPYSDWIVAVVSSA